MFKHPYTGDGFRDYGDPRKHYSRDLLLKLYDDMLRIRMIEEAIEARYHQDQMKTPIHLSIGQEAIAVGCCTALQKSDHIFCSHRTHGPYLAKGGNLNAFLSELHGRANGCVGSRGGSMHLVDNDVGVMGGSAIVAGAIPIATGAAFSVQLKNEDRITAVFFGDAATEEGVCWESLNFAALKKLPIIYLCENNHYSVCSPIDVRQPRDPIAEKARAFGVQAITTDGNNVLAVYDAVKTAVQMARSDSGATFIEAQTYRWCGHHGTGDDSHTGYRDTKEVKSWYDACPIRLFEDYLRKWKCITQNETDTMRAKVATEIEAAFEHALSSPMPKRTELFRNVYASAAFSTKMV